MPDIFTYENLIALLTLTSLEIVLGIDNVVFIAILAAKLPPHQQAKARRLGLLLALVSRIALLCAISWIMVLTEPLFYVIGRGISGRDLILLIGGMFLIGKATYEIHEKVEGPLGDDGASLPRHSTFTRVLVQIMLIDIVFSLDSVITAVGMAQQLWVMIVAVVVAVIVMLVFAGAISRFIDRHPTFKVLALSFLLLIGMMLVAEGLGVHVNKGYLYFAMVFSLIVETININAFGSRKSQGHAAPQ